MFELFVVEFSCFDGVGCEDRVETEQTFVGKAVEFVSFGLAVVVLENIPNDPLNAFGFMERTGSVDVVDLFVLDVLSLLE